MTAQATVPVEVTTRAVASGRSKDRTIGSVIFLGALWCSLLFGILVLFALIVDTMIAGSGRFDSQLFTNYEQLIQPANARELADIRGLDVKDLSWAFTGFKAGIFGSLWLMVLTALMAIPLGIAAAAYLEEFATSNTWYNRLIEINLQNLAAVPAIIYGLLALGVMTLLGFEEGLLLGGAVALALLILPVVIITTREALRAVPAEIRLGSLALGATVWQTTWRQTLPSAVPGIATGTILGLSRAIGEAAPLIVVGLATVRFIPDSPTDSGISLPQMIATLAQHSSEIVQSAASAAIILLLVMILGMNAIAIIIRNKFQRTW